MKSDTNKVTSKYSRYGSRPRNDVAPLTVLSLCMGCSLITPCIFCCCFFAMITINAQPLADYLAPEPYPNSQFMGGTGYGGSDSVWHRDTYCIEDDAQTVITYYEGQDGSGSWSFGLAKTYDEATGWHDEKEDIFGLSKVTVSIYPLDMATNAEQWETCQGKSVLVIYKSWAAQ